MIKKCNINDYDNVISYIGDDYYKCLYLYLDFKKYGFESEFVNIYFQVVDESISAIILTYYSSMHVFSKNNNIDYSELTSLVKDINPTMICGEKSIIENINKRIYDGHYKIEIGFVRSIKYINYDENLSISLAAESDFHRITELMMSDKGLSGAFSYNELYKQLLERNKEKFCRNYVYKIDGKIVAHICSGAEDEKYAILTDLIVDKDYRKRGIGKKICQDFCKLMIDEGKEVFLINYTKESGNLYEKIGFKKECEWAKLYRESRG